MQMNRATLNSELETSIVNRRILEALIDDLTNNKQTIKTLKAIQKTFQFRIEGFSKLKKQPMFDAVLEGAKARLTVVIQQVNWLTNAISELPEVINCFRDMYTEVKQQFTRKKAAGFGA
ncbi:hypothetical protein AHIS2_p061 [Acaryochloris phage A-HIS2]|nr:hypothetical protein AHIS2_p061 [Acaryochloris phage A-HIS2]